MHQRIHALLPPDAWAHLSPALYLAFWSLALYDVDVPESLYLEEIRRLEGLVRTLGRAMHAEDKAADGLLKTVRWMRERGGRIG